MQEGIVERGRGIAPQIVVIPANAGIQGIYLFVFCFFPSFAPDQRGNKMPQDIRSSRLWSTCRLPPTCAGMTVLQDNLDRRRRSNAFVGRTYMSATHICVPCSFVFKRRVAHVRPLRDSSCPPRANGSYAVVGTGREGGATPNRGRPCHVFVLLLRHHGQHDVGGVFGSAVQRHVFPKDLIGPVRGVVV